MVPSLRSLACCCYPKFHRVNIAAFFIAVLAMTVCLSSVADAQSQSPEANYDFEIVTKIDRRAQVVIDDYIEALGGAMLIQSIESAKIEGKYASDESVNEFSMMMTSEGDYLLTYGSGKNRVFGNRLHQWTHNEGAEPANNESVPYSETFPVVSTVVSWSQYHGEILYIGEEEHEGTTLHVLMFRSPGRIPVKRYFDAESNLLVAQFVNRYFQRFEYKESNDLQVISRQVLYDARKAIHQIIEYKTLLDVEVDINDFKVPAEMEEELKSKLQGRIEAGFIEPEGDTLRYGVGDR